MPEGDTVYQTAKRLDGGLSGQVITKSDFRIPSLATRDLSGATVLETLSRGKHLLTRFDNGLTLRTHLKMEGNWVVHPTGTRWRRPAHTARVVLRTATTEAVGFQVVMDLVRSENEDELVGHLGPDLLGPDWDAEPGPGQPARPARRPDRRRAARPAQPRRHRQRLQVRPVLPRSGRPAHTGRRRARPATDRREGQGLPRGQQGPLHPDHDGRPAPGLPALGLRPAWSVPALRHGCPEGRSRTARPGAADVLVSVVPANDGRLSTCPAAMRAPQTSDRRAPRLRATDEVQGELGQRQTRATVAAPHARSGRLPDRLEEGDQLLGDGLRCKHRREVSDARQLPDLRVGDVLGDEPRRVGEEGAEPGAPTQ